MKKMLIIAILLLASVLTVYPCGAPGPIQSRITPANATEWGLLRGLTVQLVVNDCPICEVETARVNPFGYYYFPLVQPCTEYRITPVAGKRPVVFEPAFRIIMGGNAPYLEENFTVTSGIFIE